jgi:drug/metabolite transporter (DMT)-like permease
MTLIPLVWPFDYEQNVPLAIVIVVFSSFLFAGGATIQHLAIARTDHGDQTNPSMSLRQMLGLLKNRLWLIGLATVVTGATLHIVGVALAPVTVVQPVGILAVPWSVLLAAKIHGFRPTKLIWSAVALTILGIVGFTYFSASTAAEDTVLDFWRIVIGVPVVFAIGGLLGFLGTRASSFRRCLLLASAGSFFFGMSPTMIKTLLAIFKRGNFGTDPLLYVVVGYLLVCYAAGAWLIQQAYANGPAEIVVGSMTTTDPIVAVTFALVALGEGARVDLFAGAGMLVAGAIAIGGVVVLSKYHPDALGREKVSAPDRVTEPAS